MTIKPDIILQNINGALKNKKLYPAGHVVLDSIISKAYRAITEYVSGEESAFFGMIEENLVFDDIPVMNAGDRFPELLGCLKKKSIEAIIFEKDFSEEELREVLNALYSDQKTTALEMDHLLRAKGVRRIKIRAIVKGERLTIEVYDDAIEVMHSVMGDLRMGKIPHSSGIREIVTEMTDTILTQPSSILALTMIKDYDDYLYTHCVNVGLLSVSIGNIMGLEKTDLNNVGIGGLLHDLGKIAVSEDIYKKTTALSGGEWEKLKAHPIVGSDIAKRMEGLEEAVIRIIYEHHMKYDNSGYPKADIYTKRLDIGQIVTVADTYDALTTLRVYQRRHQPIEAIKIMNGLVNSHFHPGVFNAFIKLLGVYPIGTLLQFPDGNVGIVTSVDAAGSGDPTVRLILNNEGREINTEEEFELDLTAEHKFDVLSPENAIAKKINISNFFKDEASKEKKAAEENPK